ncbi:MAG: PASTA domain-containing protein [Candidatus Eremiobacteraeota bacterium]|nr:PASTA domain-containing protein [Candidatus Eremiobacteraeota bacterium]
MQLDGADTAPVAQRRRFAPLLDRDWLLALALALAVGVTVWFGRSIKEFFAPSAASVFTPAFTGQTQVDANAECGRLRLRCVVIATTASDQYPKGVVMSQQPDAGARVREGRQISLIVSSGVTIFPMPDLRFESLRNAGLDLNRFKLQLDKTTYVPNDEAPRDYVVGQDPAPLASVRQGSKVSLQVSKGPPGAVKVQNFVGMSVDDARAAASKARIHLGQIVWTPFGPGGARRGEVIRQSPSAGASMDPFEEVSLQVSAGPGEYGYLIRQVHAAATVPARDDSARVRIEVRDDTGTWNIYDGFAQGGQKLDFTVTAVGNAEIDTYINNELQNQTVIGREPARWIPSVSDSKAAAANASASPKPEKKKP